MAGMTIEPSRPTEIAGRYALRERRERFSYVVGILSNKAGQFALVLTNDEIGSPRRFQRATRRVKGLWSGADRPSGGMSGDSAYLLTEQVLDGLQEWAGPHYYTERRVPHGTEVVLDVVAEISYLSWRLTLVDTRNWSTHFTPWRAIERGVVEPEEEIFVWDGKGSWDIPASKAHVHRENGKCVKNRYGEKCN